MLRSSFLLASSCLLAAPALAQQAAPAESPPPAPPAQHVDEHTHHHGGDEIVVTGHLVRELDLLAGKSVLTGTELQREMRPQLGDSLAKQAGVSATSFSPGASRPVLRGFQGERIRVLTDGIGGAVNVIDRRIPRNVPEDGHHVDITGVLGSAADERSIGAAADLALGKGGLVLHLDGSYRKSDDLRVGGHVLSPELRAEQLEIAEEELEEGHAEEAAEALELAGLRGEIPNSATEQKSAGLGVALIRDNFNIGASVSLFDSNYGVPSRPGAER